MNRYRIGVKPETAFIAEWIGRMNRKHGGTVNYRYDWGQALCVEMYGKNNDDWPDDPVVADVEAAKRWEADEFPEWIFNPRHEKSDPSYFEEEEPDET